MGYSTDFTGEFTIEPPLNDTERTYLMDFAMTRHCQYRTGEYTVGDFRHDDPVVINNNAYQAGQPGYWCNWEPTEDGTGLRWNEAEKTYDSPEWITYLIENFLGAGAKVQRLLDAGHFTGVLSDQGEIFAQFTFDHVVNGEVDAQGEDDDDQWKITVTDNVVSGSSPR